MTETIELQKAGKSEAVILGGNCQVFLCIYYTLIQQRKESNLLNQSFLC